MGIWFLESAAAYVLGGKLGALYPDPSLSVKSTFLDCLLDGFVTF